MRSSWLALLLAVAAQAAPGLQLEGGPFLPYRVNRAIASQSTGILGNLELLGRRWDGAQVPLFRTRVAARSQTVELVFYLDEDIRGLELRMAGQGTEMTTTTELLFGDGRSGVLATEEAALRNRMRSLDPPVHLDPIARPPERFSLVGSDLVLAGLEVSSALFALPAGRAPLAVLGGFALVAVLASALGSRVGRILRAGAVLGATVAVAVLAAPRPMLIRVTFPSEGPGTRISGVVERRTEELPDYTRVTYAAGQGEGLVRQHPGTADLVGLWAPAGRGIPMADLLPSGSLVRFSSPPMASRVDGELRFESNDFITGWVVHAPH